MPRIKKRQLNPRDDFMEEYLDPEFANYVKELITANQAISTVVKTPNGNITIDKPLFIKIDQNKAALSAGLLNEQAWLPGRRDHAPRVPSECDGSDSLRPTLFVRP